MDLTHVGLALAEIGEIRWRRGDLAGAEEAFTRAEQLGSTPHPGMALVRLAEGDSATAAASLRRGTALWREAGAPYETARARLLLGEALERDGDRKHALLELRHRQASIRVTGAQLDLQRARLLAAT
jgi:hypothetical protein